MGALFVQSSAGTPLGPDSTAPDRHSVFVCADCGQFQIMAHKEDVFLNVRFTLGHPRLVEAAGRFMDYLNEAEGQATA